MTKPRSIKLIGRRIGRLYVVAEGPMMRVGRDRYERSWCCRCDCGSDRVIRQSSLTSRRPTQSCGCLHLDSVRAKGPRKHDCDLYSTWAGIKTRCFNPNCENYKYYGAIGIRMCERWASSYDNFRSDVGGRPSPQHSLDRINPFGDYEPNNVRWATAAVQRMNRRSVA